MRNAIKKIVLVVIAIDVIVGLILVAMKFLIPSKGDEQSDEVELVTIMGGREFASESQAFRGGSCLAIASGVVLDLRGAKIHPDGGHLEVRAIMSGVSIVVPKGVSVLVERNKIAGSVVNRTEPSEPGAPRLTVVATAAMAGVEVSHKSVTEDPKPLIEEGVTRAARAVL